MANPILSFVAGPAVPATTIIALNPSDSLYSAAEEFTLGTPTFEAGPDSVGGEYGWREVSFTVVLKGSYSAVAAAQQAISRQLVAARSWLMMDMGGTSKPMFLRTYRSRQQALSWEQTDFGTWILPVTLTCDPWIYGTLQTIGPVTINNDPLAGTRPCSYAIPQASILGDAPAPARLTVVPSTSWTRARPLFSLVATEGGFFTGPQPWDATAFTAGTDTTHTTSGATGFSGGTKSAVSFATNASLVGRLQGTAPAANFLGSYKVLARVQRPAAGASASDVFQMRLAQGASGSGTVFYRGETKRVSFPSGSTSALATWVDLGEFTFPFGSADLKIDDALPTSTLAPYIYLDVARIAGTGTLEIDTLLLVPIEVAISVLTRTLTSGFPDLGPTSTNRLIYDGDRRRFIQYRTSDGLLIDQPAPVLGGEWPDLVPGVDGNLLTFLQQTYSESLPSGAIASDAITQTASVTIEYFPRYLHLRPDTT